jgi:Uma2 family endonuclease
MGGDHTGYRVGDGWIEPDASISWPSQPQDDKYLLRAPMVALEILSPGEDIEEKLTLYFDEGALEGVGHQCPARDHDGVRTQ